MVVSVPYPVQIQHTTSYVTLSYQLTANEGDVLVHTGYRDQCSVLVARDQRDSETANETQVTELVVSRLNRAAENPVHVVDFHPPSQPAVTYYRNSVCVKLK